MKKYLFGGIIVVIGITLGFAVARNIATNYIFSEEAPTQPINFSHKIHAGDNKIACRLCHIYAWRSRVSGVPPVSRCMGCHKSVRVNSPEIRKIQTYWKKKQPIRWIKVYDLPDYIYFPHKRHVRAGLRCQECHGAIEKMAKVKRVVDLNMGWCLDCHRNKTFVGADGKKRHGPRWDCWECHT